MDQSHIRHPDMRHNIDAVSVEIYRNEYSDLFLLQFWRKCIVSIHICWRIFLFMRSFCRLSCLWNMMLMSSWLGAGIWSVRSDTARCAAPWWPPPWSPRPPGAAGPRHSPVQGPPHLTHQGTRLSLWQGRQTLTSYWASDLSIVNNVSDLLILLG